ncbi:TPA: replication protein RepA4 [Klebsiella pneumoniae]|nr:replication protein RepA4 [Klebsiella pneumoniae]
MLYAVGVVPARRQPQSGRISALAGRRAAYERVPDTDRSTSHSEEEE